LHLSLKVGDLRHNALLLQQAARQAADLGAEWVVTPELCLSGYEFTPYLGTEWICEQPDPLVTSFCELCKELRVTFFLGHAERDPLTRLLHNTVLAIGPDGTILDRHRKRAIIPGVEAWSARNERIAPIAIPSPGLNAGVLICADAYTPDVANSLRAQGADILVSSAAWSPHPHGPENCWEDRSRETGLPLFVCNRTGADHSLGFFDAESVVAVDGSRVFSFKSSESTVILVAWDLERRALVRYGAHRVAAGGLSTPCATQRPTLPAIGLK
jgi:predicted amidohydrolase